MISRTSVEIPRREGVAKFARDRAVPRRGKHSRRKRSARGNRVAVNVQLIDAMHDRHLWANRYDRTMADSLGLQGELAAEIAAASARHTQPEEKIRVGNEANGERGRLRSLSARDAIAHNPDTLLQDYKTRRTTLPAGDRARSEISRSRTRVSLRPMRRFSISTSRLVNWATKAHTEAETALELQPSLAEAHFALGQCIYWIDGDYERALPQFETAQNLSPNSGEVSALIAAIKRRQGHWQESLDAYERRAAIDPQNPNIVRNIVFTNTAMRRWPEAARAAERFARDGAGFARRENSKRLRRFLVERQHRCC